VDICKGLLALHENELTHGNLKTKHAFLYKDGTVKLGFYGFQKSIFNNLQRLPLTYFEPAYLSPEIVGGADITDSRKCDVYAFGIVFLELVTRMPAWPDDTPMIVGLQIYNNETPPIPKYVPKELQTIMQEAWMPVAERSSISAILDKLSKLNF
jgi:serine/threonine protein kinase